MNYWLVKSEPFVYSWEQFLKDGQTCWSGVRNFAARIHLNGMKKGDQVMFYHSNEGLEVVGIAKVSKTAYQDPTTDDERWVRDTSYAVKREGRKTAIRVFDNEEQAKALAEKEKGYVEVRKGEAIRCTGNFCGVAKWCSQFQKEQDNERV